MLMLLCGGIEPLPSPDSMTRTEFQPLILKKGLKFVHQNIRGLSNNFGMFQEFIACHKIFSHYLKLFYQVAIQTPRIFSVLIAVD